ncbi:hypothetical protein [Pantoea deleyi]|uniref:hypothetical protein n=1 Tax=Pantoea deleyi TaxID=470932 RepID=UPI000FE144BF|nr:hypothetical protein [Pantoea deleyi]
MAKVKRISEDFTPATSKATAPSRMNKDGTSSALSLDDFTGEYRDVVKELVAMKRQISQASGNPVNPVLNKIVEQAVMRIVHVGQKQRIAPSKVRKNVMASSAQSRITSEWKPQADLERRAGMLAGSAKLRKIG